MTILRTAGWEQRLWAVTAAAVETPHAWGTHDCALFVADCIEAMTGFDLAADWRGSYSTETEAMAIIADAGAETLGDFAALHLPEVPLHQTRRGDIVLCTVPGGADFLALVDRHTALAPGADGLVHVPRRQFVRAFKVG